MRRIAILAARALIGAALVAAVADIHLPGSSTSRRRLHLIDRSGSVLVPGPSESLTPEDAHRLIEFDRTLAEPGDEVDWASFAADVAFQSETVAPDGTDLEGAIEKALAQDPTEIVLHTDGQADPGRSLLLCRERRIPVHVFPLGPREVRDARLSRVRAPATAAPDEDVAIDLTIEATFAGTIRVRVDGTARDLDVGPGASTSVSFPRRGPGPFKVTIETEDACPQNNSAEGRISPRSEGPRILTLREGTPFDEDLASYAAVVLDNVTPTPDQQKALADYVRELGGGLLILGGNRSYALGNWKGTTLEALSPFRANPDQQLAVVFAIDASGSMAEPPEKIRDVLAAVRNAWSLREEGDSFRALILPGPENRPYFVDRPADLRNVRPSGGTVVAPAMTEARLHLQPLPGRKHLVLLTDGETAEAETPEMRREAYRALLQADIKLTVVTTHRKLEVGEHYSIDNWAGLERAMISVYAGLRDVEKKNPGILRFSDHESCRGVRGGPVPWMNHTSAKPNVQVVGKAGELPAVYDAVAFHSVGRGRVGAMTLRREDLPPNLLEQSIRYVSGDAKGGLSLSLDYPVVRARGSGPPSIQALYRASGASGAISLHQVTSDVWEGTLPPTGAGTVSVRLPRYGASASATIPSAAEYARLGIDAAALHRLAGETGGRVLGSPGALEALPRPGRSADVSGRPFFLLTALLLVFLELALTTFWKEKGAAYPKA